MSEQTSSKVSTMAGRIMSEAQRGGPFKVHAERLSDAISGVTTPATRQAVLDAVESVLRPYIDAAESVAASALSQDETPGQA